MCPKSRWSIKYINYWLFIKNLNKRLLKIFNDVQVIMSNRSLFQHLTDLRLNNEFCILFAAGWGSSRKPRPWVTDVTLTRHNFAGEMFTCECRYLNTRSMSANSLLRNHINRFWIIHVLNIINIITNQNSSLKWITLIDIKL